MKTDNKIIVFNKNTHKKWRLLEKVKPFVTFYYQEYTFFLNMYFSKNQKINSESKYQIKYTENLNECWVDTTNILIMDTEEFDLLYRNVDFTEISDLEIKDMVNIIKKIQKNFKSKNSAIDKTIQKVQLNKSRKFPESKAVYSTFPIKLSKQLLDEESYHCRDSFLYVLDDFESLDDKQMKDLIQERKNNWLNIIEKYRNNKKLETQTK